jgi:BlaI family transcriptional regulator, penicillinase repressor
MTPERVLPKPTDAELSILRVLWVRGASTVREVHDVMAEHRSLAYTTTLKLLQIMTTKGLTEREAEGRLHRYRASRAKETTQQHLVSDLLERGFGGSASKLVMQALAARPASREELAEIRQLLATAEKKQERDDA